MSNLVFIAISLDGYIADKDGGIDWLKSIPNPDNLDMGYMDFIDEMIITVIPTLLGGGSPLFGNLPEKMEFEHVNTEVFLNAIVQTHYRR